MQVMPSVRQERVVWGNPYWEVLCVLPVILAHRLCYNLTGEILSRQGTNYGAMLSFPWDLSIPYIPVFILPYLFAWVYGIVVLLYVFYAGTYDHQTFRYFYISFLVLTAVECLIWFFFPARIMIRVPPDLLLQSGWLGSLTAYAYERATPWNVFPSAHIASSFIIWLFSRHFALAGHRWWFLALFVIICLSVVFVKNHYIADIGGGMLIGYLVYRFVFLTAYRRRILDNMPTPAMLGLCYSVFGIAAFGSMSIHP